MTEIPTPSLSVLHPLRGARAVSPDPAAQSALGVPLTARTATVGLFLSPPEFMSFSMERYAEGLAAELREVLDGEPALEEVRPSLSRRPTRFRRTGIGARIFRYWRRYPAYMLDVRSTSYGLNHVLDHAYGHLTFALDPSRTIVTCHDIFPLKHWWGHVPGLPARRTPPLTVQFSVRGVQRARAVITPSKATKRDLVEHVGIAPERVYVVPYGVDRAFGAFARDVRLDARRALGDERERRILVVSTGPAYKNTRAMVEVAARVVQKSPETVRLVHVGPALPAQDRAFARWAGIADRVVELGPVPAEEMPRIYNGCDVLLFPSHYEGFGWPPLEAMACGLPVVCSRAAAVSEVVADAALLADADDHEGLASNVLRAFGSDTAGDLAMRGQRRVAQFTWRRAAERTAAIYIELLEGRK